MRAFVFPGQASQFEGMGKDLYETSEVAKETFEEANQILGFRLSDVMFEGTAEDLKETRITQPAVFLHSIVKARMNRENFDPAAVAGHSLGEFSALVANGVLSFEDGLLLVQKRALAMQEACEKQAGTMAAIVGLDDEVVEDICASIEALVVPANYNCPGQLVISGSVEGVEAAMLKMEAAGARKIVRLAVSGAFHSPLMEPAKDQLKASIDQVSFQTATCPIYQNFTAKAETDPAIIKQNLIDQLTAPVRWTATIQNMIADGMESFAEVGGKGKTLRAMIRRINREIPSEVF
ncbi:MAG: ACP S-malonyltransferase [Saprospiraceae bacterium]